MNLAKGTLQNEPCERSLGKGKIGKLTLQKEPCKRNLILKKNIAEGTLRKKPWKRTPWKRKPCKRNLEKGTGKKAP